MMWSGGSLLLGIYGCDGGIHLLLRLQWMPLGDGAAGVGQHVGPMFQPGPRGLASHQDLPNGVVLANLVIIQDCDYSLDFLWKWRESLQKTAQTPRGSPSLTQDALFSSPGWKRESPGCISPNVSEVMEDLADNTNHILSVRPPA